jgi:hypothetical protein
MCFASPSAILAEEVHVLKSAILIFAFIVSASAFAQSGAPTGTFINPSVPNGVESNPQTFENVQPVLGPTPPPAKHPKFKKQAKGSNVVTKPGSFVSPPDTMAQEQSTPAPKVNH